MRNKLRRLATLFIAAMMAALPFAAAASPVIQVQDIEYAQGGAQAAQGLVTGKEEVVYANLLANGAVDEIYVVNILKVAQAGQVRDYGGYRSVNNLTDTQPVSLAGDEVRLNAPKGNYYYQGSLQSKDLPWEIAVEFRLDGKTVTPEQAAGAKGRLEISVATRANGAVDALFYENYMLQISITLDTQLCSNIVSEGATLANTGKNKLITHTVMPGAEGNIKAAADVVDFEMPGIEVNAVPFSMKIDKPDTGEMADKITTLSDAISELNEGVGDLLRGASSLSGGTFDLWDGSGEINDGLAKLDKNSGKITDGSKQIRDALDVIAYALSNPSSSFDMSALEQLPGGLLQLAAGLDAAKAGLAPLVGGYSQAYAALEQTINDIPSPQASQADIQQLIAAVASSSSLATAMHLAQVYEKAQTAKGTFNNAQIKQAFDGVVPALNGAISGMDTISSALKSMAAQIQSQMEDVNVAAMISQLGMGISDLARNYRDFHDGLAKYADGVSELAQSYGEFHDGLGELADGTGSLRRGVADLYEGTSELDEKVGEMPDQIEIEIDKLLDGYDKSGFTPVSFVSQKNTNTASVQFVIKTAAIELPEAEKPAEQPAPKQTFWSRLVDLFRRK